jgi:hypothetical protein
MGEIAMKGLPKTYSRNAIQSEYRQSGFVPLEGIIEDIKRIRDLKFVHVHLESTNETALNGERNNPGYEKVIECTRKEIYDLLQSIQQYVIPDPRYEIIENKLNNTVKSHYKIEFPSMPFLFKIPLENCDGIRLSFSTSSKAFYKQPKKKKQEQ